MYRFTMAALFFDCGGGQTRLLSGIFIASTNKVINFSRTKWFDCNKTICGCQCAHWPQTNSMEFVEGHHV